MSIDEYIDLIRENYQPLSPFKCFKHSDRLEKFFTQPFEVAPVTAHLVPTLYCNQRCYFCTYGQYKENGRNAGLQMNLAQTKSCIDQLAGVGVKGIIFTGGGEPTLYPDLVESMAYARQAGLDVALNTNAYRCSDALVDGILNCKPTYIRISLNNGRALTQKLVTGRDNYDQVLENVRRFAERKCRLSPQTDLSVGYVVNIVNLYEMPEFLDRMLRIERRVVESTGAAAPIYSLQFRPVSNFEHSKHTADAARMEALLEYVMANHGMEDRNELEDFILHGAQPSRGTIERALRIIEEELIPTVEAAETGIRIIYPKRKFRDLISGSGKPYDRCLSCPWYLFIWPDGSVYHCVEWAGDPEFAIGNMFTTPLSEILSGEKRAKVLAKINNSVIKERCVTVCAHHEMNILLNALKTQNNDLSEYKRGITQEQGSVRHVNFL